MPEAEQRILMSEQDYLKYEEGSLVRHEFIDGELFAMSGVTLRHNIIIDNLHPMIKDHLRGTPCRSFTTGVKVRVEATSSFYYPDILVSCTPVNTEAYFFEEPILIVEVTSPSTAAIDRREKRNAYRQLKSLKEYLIVHQSQRRVEVFRKTASGKFAAAEQFIGEGAFSIDSLPNGSLVIDLAQLYADLEWGATPNYDEPDSDMLVREIVGELAW